ncbi:unnamed protein product [Coccothraustes coccothraustes]
MERRQLGACARIGRRGRAKGEHVAGAGHVVGPGGGPGGPAETGGVTGPGRRAETGGRDAAIPRQSRLPRPALRRLAVRSATVPEQAFALRLGRSRRCPSSHGTLGYPTCSHFRDTADMA